MPLYRKLLGVSAAAALTASVSRARREARRRAIELGAPFGVLPTLPTGEAQRVGVVYNPSKPGIVAAIEFWNVPSRRTVTRRLWCAPPVWTSPVLSGPRADYWGW